ncbi:MAG: hypothetical protein JSV89_10525 [Spirochaetaceae bacterium]|nr:MAG: hypothetical protein JSV89_10525 [Spirochaetaceae bacterium]
MGSTISIKIQNQSFSAELNDSTAASSLLNALPLKLRMSRWGEEFYGDCGLAIAKDASARELLEAGEIAYWPPGSALCFFFGPTPASTDERPRAASPVVPLGKFIGGVEALKSFGSSIEVELYRE